MGKNLKERLHEKKEKKQIAQQKHHSQKKQFQQKKPQKIKNKIKQIKQQTSKTRQTFYKAIF